LRIVEAAALLLLLAGGFALFRWNADFPVGLHPDESRKARAVAEAQPEFLHPLALHHATRAAAFATGAQTRQQVVEAGRLASALFATGLVLASHRLFRRRLAAAPALVGAAVVALTPIVSVHAHYLKEDAVFSLATTLAVLALLALVRAPSPRAALWLGVATGFAVSAKYAGGMLFAVYALMPLVAPVGDRRAWLRSLGVVALVAAGVFAVLNAPAFLRPEAFAAGLRFEAEHALRGHDFPIWAPPQRFAFHLRHSIVPGLGAALAIAGLAGAAWMARRGDAEDRVVVLCLAVFYLAIELAPIKVFPDFMRYALPLAPLWILCAARGLDALCARAPARPALAALLLAALAIAPAWRSWRLVSALDDDTRIEAAARWRTLDGPVLVDDYSLAWRETPRPKLDMRPLFDRDAAERDAAHWAITSSFRWERYFFGAALPDASDETKRRADFYRALFACRYEEIRPRFGSFAFSNPTIRIVDLEACPKLEGAFGASLPARLRLATAEAGIGAAIGAFPRMRGPCESSTSIAT